ncbi:MAG: Vgr family protein [Bacteroidetes bacterium 43-16]|nr:MAG: Vgr family protein [Bacteroidetes bacterium 43-16]
MYPSGQQNDSLGITPLCQLKIVVEGQSVHHYKSLTLHQTAKGHHSFELTLAHDSLGTPEDHNMQQVQKLLGKRISISFSYRNIPDGPERDFVGVITEIGFCREHRNNGDILLTGYSPTILLDAAPHIQSFGGAKFSQLQHIAESVIKEGLGSGKYNYKVDPQYQGDISYMCQYNETHYNFLQRTAAAYGEQFFYDGNTLLFGKLPASEASVSLVYGRNVHKVQIGMKVQHLNPSYYGYNSSEDNKLVSGKTKINQVATMGKSGYEISEQTFLTPALSVAPIKAHTPLDVSASQAGAIGSKAVEVFTTSGITSVPFLYPGCVVDIEMLQPGGNTTSYFTKLMVTSIQHEVDVLGHYKGSFEAVGADTGFLPKGSFQQPKAEQQFATVISNADPSGQGRVQVRMDWQGEDAGTEWIRVLMPDAGGTDRVSQNRGHVFIPEEGDQVMLGFVHQHPDRPFVMGGLFHGGTGLGGNTDNRVKSIQTRSGHRIVFTEDESIIITDKSGNEIHLDTTGSNINITAPETMTLNCKNMFINVGENMSTNVGMNQTESIGMNAAQSVGMIKTTNVLGDNNLFITGKLLEIIEGDVLSEVKQGKTIVNADQGIETISNASINNHAQNEVQINSGEKSNNY